MNPIYFLLICIALDIICKKRRFQFPGSAFILIYNIAMCGAKIINVY